MIEWLRRMIGKSGVGHPQSWFLRALGGAPTATGLTVNSQTALQVAAVYASVNVLASDVAKLPIMVFRRTGADQRNREPVTAHPAYRVLHLKPNSWQTRVVYREQCMTALLLHGNAYSYRRYDERGQLEALIPLRPDRTQLMEAADGALVYQVMRSGAHESTQLAGEGLSIAADRIMHTRGLTLDGLYGVSPIRYLRETIGLALATERHGSKLFGNAARPGGVLTHPGTLSAEALQRLKASWQESHGGVENAWKTAILEEGMKWERLSMTAEDAQFLESRKFSVEDIARIWRVPPHKIGHLERSTNNNIEHQALEYVTDALMPWLERLEASYERDLLSETEQAQGYFIEHNVMRLLRGDIKSRYEAYGKGRQWGWLSVNDIREMENLPLIEDGDEYLKPMNMMPIGMTPMEENTGN